MGGELIVKIIDDASWLKDTDKRLILQPMTHPEKLREYLIKNGFNIVGETLSYDRGKIYQTICAEYDGFIRDFDIFSLHFGKFITSKKSKLLTDLLNNTKKQLILKIEGKREGNEDTSYEKELLINIENYIKE
jgi:tRNA A22 N-methylase